MNSDNLKILHYPKELKNLLQEKIKESEDFSDVDLDKFLFIVHQFYSKKRISHLKDLYKDGIPINVEKLKKLIAHRYAGKLLKALIEWNIIHCQKANFTPGKSARKYDLLSPFDTMPYQRNKHYPKNSKHWLNKFIKERCDDFGDIPGNGIEKYQLKILDRITLSDEFYKDFSEKYLNIDLTNLPDDFIPNDEDHSIFDLMFRNSRYSKRRPDKEDRLYTNIVNLKSEYRKYILIDGKRLISIDIKSSQLFLGIFKIEKLIRMKAGKQILDKDMPEDFKRFKHEILNNNDVYKFITESLIEGYEKDISYEKFEMIYSKDRKNFKQHIFQFIWYCYYQYPNSDNDTFKIFKSQFPSIGRALNSFKSLGKSTFPVLLQKQEANLILDRIGKTLMKEKTVFLTIHDSVLVTNEKDLSFAESVIKNVFEKEFGVSSKFDIKRY